MVDFVQFELYLLNDLRFFLSFKSLILFKSGLNVKGHFCKLILSLDICLNEMRSFKNEIS